MEIKEIENLIEQKIGEDIWENDKGKPTDYFQESPLEFCKNFEGDILDNNMNNYNINDMILSIYGVDDREMNVFILSKDGVVLGYGWNED